jgi:uncharacterized protein DUF3127
MDITGILKFKGSTEQVSDKFKKREIVITDNSSQYPQHISFQLAQDKCSLADKLEIGEAIKVHFNLRGKEWNSPKGEVRYFNTLEIWRIESADATDMGKNVAETPTSFTASSQEDDLPFKKG